MGGIEGRGEPLIIFLVRLGRRLEPGPGSGKGQKRIRPMIFRILAKSYDRFITGLHLIGSALVFILMMIILGDVFGRTLFNHPLTGAPELAKVSLVALLFLGLAKTLRMNKHIRATVIIARAGPRVQAALNMTANMCGLVIFILLCWSSWDLMLAAWKVGEYEGAGALRVPTYHLRSLILLCSVLTAIQFASNMVHEAKHLFFTTRG